MKPLTKNSYFVKSIFLKEIDFAVRILQGNIRIWREIYIGQNHITLLIIVEILNTYTSIHMVKQSISLQQKLGFYSLISAKTFDTAILRSSIGTRRDILDKIKL